MRCVAKVPRKKADAAVKAGNDDLDGYIDGVIGSMPTPERPTAEDTLPLRELRGLDKALRKICGEKAVQESKKVALQQILKDLRESLERPLPSRRVEIIEREIKKAEDQLAATQESIDILNFNLRSQVRQITRF